MAGELRDYLVEEAPDRFRLRVERKLQELVEQGFFDNLPGSGRPLDLSEDDNPFVPEDMRLAFRILRNAGVAPPWIELSGEIEADLTQLRREALAYEARVKAALANLSRTLPGFRPARLARLRAEQADFLARQAAAIDDVNRKIDRFNLSVPSFNIQKSRVGRQRALARLAALLPDDGPAPTLRDGSR